MLKQPMQVYFDHEMVAFYKEMAKKQGISFAALVREVLEKEAEVIKKAQFLRKGRKDEKKDPYISLLETIRLARKKFGKGKYYHPELTDDELIYGRQNRY